MENKKRLQNKNLQRKKLIQPWVLKISPKIILTQVCLFSGL
jgi:hypothetical protein